MTSASAAPPLGRRIGLDAQRTPEAGLAAALVVLVASLWLTEPRFGTSSNILLILEQAAPVLVVAIPFAMLLIARNVDLSVGSTAAMCAVVGGYLLSDGRLSWPLAALTMLALAATVGLFNGYTCAYLGFSPIVVTLGMLGTLRGVAFVIQGDSFYSGFPHGFAYIGQGRFELFDIPVQVVIAAALSGVAWCFYNRTIKGRHAKAIGANPTASFLSGIAVRRITLGLYVATSLGAGLAAIIMISKLGSASATMAGQFEITVLTAVLLGGVAFEGGRGSLFGVVLGTLFIHVLSNGFTHWGLSTDQVRLANGAVLVLAAGLQAFAAYLARSS